MIDPALWNDHGHWQVVHDETCLFLPRPLWPALSGPRWSYVACRVWCLLHGYGWLPIT